MTPFYRQVRGGFGGGEDGARVDVPVEDDGGAGGDEGGDVLGEFPAVGGEEEVDRVVV